jgi:hypothetical protein
MHNNYSHSIFCNPYICFGNRVAILRGHTKESQSFKASSYAHIQHHNESTYAANAIVAKYTLLIIIVQSPSVD